MIAEYVRNTGLTLFPKLGLVLFVLVYIGALWLVFSPMRKKIYETLSRLPLEPEHKGETQHE